MVEQGKRFHLFIYAYSVYGHFQHQLSIHDL